MPCPGNGIYVVQGEMAILLSAMRRGARWSSHTNQVEEQDALTRSFTDLKDTLNQIGDLKELDPNQFLGPFLDVIRSEETTGPVTSLALSSVNKFIAYGLIDSTRKSVPAAVENIADAVTHARFVGTDQASDGVVLMRILQVLRTLMLSPEGTLLSNESVCEIMLSCFKLSFETRLTELLRRSAEHCLKDMIQHLFSRLPQFHEDLKIPVNIKKLKMRTGSTDSSKGKRKQKMFHRYKSLSKTEGILLHLHTEKQDHSLSEEGTQSHAEVSVTPISSGGNILDMQGAVHQGAFDEVAKNLSTTQMECMELHEGEMNHIFTTNKDRQNSCIIDVAELEEEVNNCSHHSKSKTLNDCNSDSGNNKQLEGYEKELLSFGSGMCNVGTFQPESLLDSHATSEAEDSKSLSNSNSNSPSVCLDEEMESTKLNALQKDYISPKGVRFTSQELQQTGSTDASSGYQEEQLLIPYGVVCIRELFRFLISLCNPLDKQNTEMMIHMGLTLLLVAFEIGADSIGKFNSLLSLVKDELCRNLFALLNSDRLAIFAPNLQVLFLVFESLRTHLKFQLELYLTRLIDIIISDSPKVTYEHKEIALESIVQLWRIPGLVTELYLNYDCDLYCPNLFEDITKLLSKNAFPVSGLYNTHLLSLDALLTVIDSIERHCHIRALHEQKGEKQPGELSSSDSGSTGVLSQIMLHPQSSRQRILENIPSHEELLSVKHKKKLLATGTEYFNTKPKKGIQFMQEHNLLSTPLDPQEVVNFLRENPRLDKKMIGEYISNRSNLQVLNYFVKSFDFADTRIDEALRLYLETFRLPGESPLISLIMEHFAEHWHKCNGEPFVNADAAFTLAYAVIMLNVDQHNHNVKRQNNPMTVEDFKRNLKRVNGGEDFDQDMLDDIYNSIRNEEIVMPAEQTGLVKENYLWKVLLRRGASKEGRFIHAPNGLFDYDLFALIWGPTVAALSFVFDKSNDANIYQKAISGFRKCAMISAHFGMSNDFDNLVISLCKFTTLLNSTEPPDILTISFGSNPKAQLAAKTVFSLAHRHGDILREGWKNVLDCMLQLYRCKILPEMLVEAEDFIHPHGKISLLREETPSQKAETGLFSSLYSYIALASETSSQRIPSPEDQEHIQRAQACVKECHLEHLITESKFLRLDSLQELVKALVFASHSPESHISSGMAYDEDATVFFLELLLKVVIQNRDRVHTLWQNVRDHIYSLVMGAAACDYNFLLERSVVGLLRLAIHLMRREDMSPVVLQSLRMLLLLKSATLFRVARQVAYGLFELLKTNAANIHSDSDWAIIFTLLECIGAGAPLPKVVSDISGSSHQAKKPDVEVTQDKNNESAFTSDSEMKPVSTHNSSLSLHSPEVSPSSCGGWILVGCKGDIQPLQFHQLQINQFSMINENDLLPHDPYALIKCCESLAFLVRDVAHITPYNFENCVHCIRTFVEASLSGRGSHGARKCAIAQRETKLPKKLSGSSARRKDETCKEHSLQQSSIYDGSESESEELPDLYPIQLLDLMHTLHTRTAQIFQWWAEENGGTDVNTLWVQGWCPLLQGIARLCCDSRRQVRTSAITYLQRALLVHDLQTLTAVEWESCFRNVLFPLLMKLLEPICPQDPAAMEETRMRAATVLSKVFLHHLTPLLSLPSFRDLWLTILDFMDKYMHVNKSDLLYEAVPESLKNMLLVMDSAGVFSTPDGYSELWHITWERIGIFLPKLKEELFKSHPSGPELREKEDVNTYTAETSIQTPQQFSINIPGISEYETTQVETSSLATETVVSSALKINSASVMLQLPTHTLSPSPIFTHVGQQNAFCAGAET